MKKILYIFLFAFTMTSTAQVPQGFTYQGVATDNNGFEIQNQNIGIKASILSTSSSGVVVWQETHSASTDTFGVFSIVIGDGLTTNNGSSSTFSEIDWGVSSHFLKVEIDMSGGTNYVHVGTSQIMSVPYALHAETSSDHHWTKTNDDLSYSNGSVTVGANSSDSSAIFSVQSTTQGIMLPSMTEAQKDSINSPATGLLIFQTDQKAGFYYYNGTKWSAIGSGGDNTLLYTTDGF